MQCVLVCLFFKCQGGDRQDFCVLAFRVTACWRRESRGTVGIQDTTPETGKEGEARFSLQISSLARNCHCIASSLILRCS